MSKKTTRRILPASRERSRTATRLPYTALPEHPTGWAAEHARIGSLAVRGYLDCWITTCTAERRERVLIRTIAEASQFQIRYVLQMTSTEEAVVGEIPALAKLGIGAERLRLYLTDRRLIVAHGSKQGLGALATMPILGKLGAGLGGLVKGPGESSKRRGLERLTPEKILVANKDNFYFDYRDIVRIELEELLSTVRIIILTGDDKIELFTFTGLDSVVEVFRERLGEKVVVGAG